MEIRRAVPADASTLSRIVIDSWRSAYRGIVPDSRLAGMAYDRRARRFRESLTAGTEETYIAEREGVELGFATLGACRDDDVDRSITGEIWGIYVAPANWRRGAGRLLCREAERILAARGFTRVVLWVLAANARARGFYAAMGFVVDGSEKVLDLGTPLIAVRYGKTLHAALAPAGPASHGSRG